MGAAPSAGAGAVGQVVWQPRSWPQQEALLCPAELLLFGGAAGSLKSETLLMDAASERDRARLRAVLLRRSYPELERSLIRRSREIYPSMGGAYNEQKKRWTFPSGASIEFAYCEAERDIYRYQGAEFSFIGFDESTHFSEFPIRYMLSRLRSTEPALRLRVRLATNPGNIGHNTHKAVFHGDTCTHCHLGERSRRPFALYRDAVWPSDQRPIGKTTCYIPGRLGDHDLLGADYARSLEGLPGAFRRALLEGCWDVYEGQYFDCWNPRRMVIERAAVGEQPWWTHWVAADYGFSGSQAAAYLFGRSPATPGHRHGVTYVLEECAAQHQTAEEFARAVAARWRVGGRRVAAWYLSPDAWADRGEGHSLADQMTESSGVGWEAASHDRVGGAMLIYTQLDRGDLVICAGCRQLREAVPTRIHDPGRPDDVLKIKGDPLDDCYDALRYGVYSYLGPARLPERMRIEAEVTAGDPTVAAIQRRLAEERLRGGGNGGGVYLPGRGGGRRGSSR